MPFHPPTPCAQPGCPRLTKTRRCAEHARELERTRGTPSQRGYDRSWRRLRLIVLNAHPYCQWPGCFVPATEVDHVVPKRMGGSDELSNLQALCKPHHSTKTLREMQRGGGDAPSAA